MIKVILEIAAIIGIIKLYRTRKSNYTAYLDWEAYKRRIDFLSDFHFQQDVRKQNLRSLIS